jgi:hypothetical protein
MLTLIKRPLRLAVFGLMIATCNFALADCTTTTTTTTTTSGGHTITTTTTTTTC